MNWERVAWWIFWLTFAFALVIAFYGVSLAIITATSVEFAYILGLVSFLLLGNRLLFGYGWIANLLDTVISVKEVTLAQKEAVKKRLEKKNFEPLEKLEELSFKALIMLALKDLDYYRYAYYGVFLLLTLITLLTKFNLLGDLVIGKYVEGVFWGAATVTFFVWGLEQLSKVSFVEYNLMDVKEIKNQ